MYKYAFKIKQASNKPLMLSSVLKVALKKSSKIPFITNSLSQMNQIKTEKINKGEFTESYHFFFCLRAWSLGFEMAYDCCEMKYEYFCENMLENHEIVLKIADLASYYNMAEISSHIIPNLQQALINSLTPTETFSKLYEDIDKNKNKLKPEAFTDNTLKILKIQGGHSNFFNQFVPQQLFGQNFTPRNNYQNNYQKNRQFKNQNYYQNNQNFKPNYQNNRRFPFNNKKKFYQNQKFQNKQKNWNCPHCLNGTCRRHFG